jgi:fucose permease
MALAWAAFGGMFVFGIVMALLGALLPRLPVGLGQAGNLFFALTSAMLVSMLALGPLTDRFGKKLPLAAGSFCVGAALLGIAAAPGYGLLLASICLLGAGGGALNGVTNTLVADLYSDPRQKNSALNLLGVFFGFGALFLPFLIGSLLGVLGLTGILGLAAGLSLALGVLYLALAFPPPKHAEGLPLAETARLARNPLVLLFGFLLFFQSGNEFIMGGYTSKYLTLQFQTSYEGASYILAAYWGSIMLARVISSRLLLRVQGPLVVLGSALGSAVGVTVLLLAGTVTVAALGVVLIGLSFASIYPTVLGLAGSRFEEYSGTVFGLLFAIALTGGMTLPWAVGQIAQTRNLRLALSLPALNALMIFVLQLLIPKTARYSAHAQA